MLPTASRGRHGLRNCGCIIFNGSHWRTAKRVAVACNLVSDFFRRRRPVVTVISTSTGITFPEGHAGTSQMTSILRGGRFPTPYTRSIYFLTKERKGGLASTAIWDPMWQPKISDELRKTIKYLLCFCVPFCFELVCLDQTLENCIIDGLFLFIHAVLMWNGSSQRDDFSAQRPIRDPNGESMTCESLAYLFFFFPPIERTVKYFGNKFHT